MYQVTRVRLERTDPDSIFHVHEILAEDLEPIQLVLPHQLPTYTYFSQPFIRRPSKYTLIRPWDSKLLGLSPDADDETVTNQLFTMFSQPFSAFVLEKTSPEDEYYKRIASSSPIFASLASAASIIRSKIQTVIIM